MGIPRLREFEKTLQYFNQDAQKREASSSSIQFPFLPMGKAFREVLLEETASSLGDVELDLSHRLFNFLLSEEEEEKGDDPSREEDIVSFQTNPYNKNKRIPAQDRVSFAQLSRYLENVSFFSRQGNPRAQILEGNLKGYIFSVILNEMHYPADCVVLDISRFLGKALSLSYSQEELKSLQEPCVTYLKKYFNVYNKSGFLYAPKFKDLLGPFCSLEKLASSQGVETKFLKKILKNFSVGLKQDPSGEKDLIMFSHVKPKEGQSFCLNYDPDVDSYLPLTELTKSSKNQISNSLLDLTRALLDSAHPLKDIFIKNHYKDFLLRGGQTQKITNALYDLFFSYCLPSAAMQFSPQEKDLFEKKIQGNPYPLKLIKILAMQNEVDFKTISQLLSLYWKKPEELTGSKEKRRKEIQTSRVLQEKKNSRSQAKVQRRKGIPTKNLVRKKGKEQKVSKGSVSKKTQTGGHQDKLFDLLRICSHVLERIEENSSQEAKNLKKEISKIWQKTGRQRKGQPRGNALSQALREAPNLQASYHYWNELRKFYKDDPVFLRALSQCIF